MLDMGEPVKVVDLRATDPPLGPATAGHRRSVRSPARGPARSSTRSSTSTPRPPKDRTSHPKILVARHVPFDQTVFEAALLNLRRAVETNDLAAVRKLIRRLVPEYGRQPRGLKT